MQLGHGTLDGLVVATAHLNAKDIEQLVVIRLNQQRLHGNEVCQLMARDVEHELGTLCLNTAKHLGEETIRGVGGQ